MTIETSPPTTIEPSWGTRRAIALHEAAHAVVTVVLGRKVGAVEILPDGGACETYRGPFIEDACIPLAGPIATEICTGNFTASTPQELWAAAAEEHHGYNLDLNETLDIVVGVVKEMESRIPAMTDREITQKTRKRLNHVYKKTGALVQRHWPTIETIAQALVTHGKLDGNQVEALFRKAKRERKEARTNPSPLVSSVVSSVVS